MTADSDDRTFLSPSAAREATSLADVTVRPLTTIDECTACVALQNEVWGFGDEVPATLLLVTPKVGGVIAGAFAPDGSMLGFVFGISGVRDGELVHWSHMLAVREGARNLGIGRLLKEYQRAELRRLGVARMFWTFDPLVARNAHLNLNRLGARVVEYVPDMYGITDSPLHYGLATDRLIVSCSTSAQEARVPDIPSYIEQLPVLTPFPRSGDVRLDERAPRAPVVLIEIPTDLAAVIAHSPDAAATWRVATRDHFQWALRQGYDVTALHRDSVTGRAFYVLRVLRDSRA
jgi:predicted GNAT superfamily acetyltransferase